MKRKPSTTAQPPTPELDGTFERQIPLLPPELRPGLVLWLRLLRRHGRRDFRQMDAGGEWRSV